MASLLPLAGRAGAFQKPEHVNRACEPCRLLKVRCLPSDDPSSTSCTRCTKTGRNCQYAAPQKRRPRKRTDTRVAELEREVKAMRSLLNHPGRSDSKDRSAKGEVGEELSRKISAISYNGSEATGGNSTNVSSPDKGKRQSETPPTSRNTASQSSEYMAEEKDEYHHEGLDVIDRGIISIERAKEFFSYFVNEQIPQAPLVTLRTDETFDVLRAQKPILFLVMLTSTAGIYDGDLYSTMHDETMHVFAEHYIINCGEKSLEMVQAFLLTALWLYPPDDFRRLKFYQYSHMAASMMLDIGPVEAIPLDSQSPEKSSGRPSVSPKANGIEVLKSYVEGCPYEVVDLEELEVEECYPLAPVPLKEPLEMKNEPLVVESRRTYLACYLLCSNVALSLRRPSMLTFSPLIGACISFLKRSPWASRSDLQLASWAEMQHIADECASAFSLENASLHEMSDPRLQLTLKGFETRLEDWWKALDPELINPCLRLHFYQNRIFIQEFAIMVKQSGEEAVIPSPRLVDAIYGQRKQTFSAARANAILVVVESAHALLDVIVGVQLETLRAMPIVNYARAVLSIIMLIKMSATIHAPNSELTKLIDADSLRVDYYVKEIIEKFQSLSEYRVASKFLPIIIKFAIWYYQTTDKTKKNGHNELIVPLLGLVVDNWFPKDAMSNPFPKFMKSTVGEAANVADGSQERKNSGPKQPDGQLPDVLGQYTEGSAQVRDLFKVHQLEPFEATSAGSPNADTPTPGASQNSSVGQIQHHYQSTKQPVTQGGMANQLPLPGIAEQVPLVEGMDWFHPPADGSGLFGGGEMDIDIFALTEEAMVYGELDLMNQWFQSGGPDPGFLGNMTEQQQAQGPSNQSNWRWN